MKHPKFSKEVETFLGKYVIQQNDRKSGRRH